MKKKIIDALCLAAGVLLSASLLSGANVMFTNTWYPLPYKFSKFFVMIFCMQGVALTIKKSAIFYSKLKNDKGDFNHRY
ncbi:hypothetical protein B1H58_03360 [Pantoea alhagi]|uniref:Uncharacterized protein n=1 Tax=Pantoea alhagi TaxID=1891675 RepID=A0A1W6B237_9GAMM|nr:hypothetical protein [Pantoea alhagi]ARJ41133.1 hypothetical protein B1H58_03360 [Pantoea alhagi]